MQDNVNGGLPTKAKLVKSLGVIPQNLVSLAVGGLVRTPLPTFLAKPLNKAFVSAFKINMAEAERPLAEYRTIEDIFTRKLQAGSRSLAQGYVSPADGILERSEPANDQGHAVQAKGHTYSLRELVFGADATVTTHPDFSPNWFTTVYLAPHNYHRVHTPCAGQVTALRYIPGRLWPVNRPAVLAIPRLFCRNERLVFDIEVPGGGKAWAVMVGALNVGRIVTPIRPDFVSNSASRQFRASEQVEMVVRHPLAVGDEIGTFMLGSTVIVVFDKKAVEILNPKRVETPQTVRMGQSLSL